MNFNEALAKLQALTYEEDPMDVIWNEGYAGLVVETKQLAAGRWDERIREVYAFPGEKFLAVEYSRGLTEMQDPFPSSKAYEVWPVEQKRIEYVSWSPGEE